MGIDYQLFSLVNRFAGQNQYIDYIAVFLAVYLIFGFAILILLRINNKKLLITAALSSLLAFESKHLISLFYFRPRPFMDHTVNLIVNRLSDSSFPSNHASVSFAIATSIFFYDRKLGIIAFVMAGLIAVSRVFVGVHYPFDILIGSIIGILSAYLSYHLVKYLSKNKKIRASKWPN
ncbi:MAG: phosphatase PAP2 family protein [Candidatus Woesearchaeota archaeon]|nr:phosphatase PAP2 family protein [Candidatus Woesearchaeota archaeon]